MEALCEAAPLNSQLWVALPYESRATDAFACHARELWLYRDLFSCVVTVHVRERNERVQQRCSARRVLCAQLLHQMLAAMLAELSSAEAFAARTSCCHCRGLFSCGPAVFERDDDAWVQRRCPAGCVLCAQTPLDSLV